MTDRLRSLRPETELSLLIRSDPLPVDRLRNRVCAGAVYRWIAERELGEDRERYVGFRERTGGRLVRQPPSGSGLQTDLVVDRLAQPLLEPEVPFRCFHRDVTEKELDLL